MALVINVARVGGVDSLFDTEDTEEEEGTERRSERFAPLSPRCRGMAAPKAQ